MDQIIEASDRLLNKQLHLPAGSITFWMAFCRYRAHELTTSLTISLSRSLKCT